MPKPTPTTREPLEKLSERWRERNGLPVGMFVTLIRREDGRQVRKDTNIHRRALPKRAGCNSTVKAALDDLAATFVTEIAKRGMDLRLRHGDGTTVGGNTRMITLRQMGASQDEESQENFSDEEEILESKNKIEGHIENYRATVEDHAINELEYGESFKPIAIARGAIRALEARLGAAILQEALEAEDWL